MTDHLKVYERYKKSVDDVLLTSYKSQSPVSLYEPLKYIINGGGKRVRPMMLIFSCEALGGKFEDAINAAAAMELLHNFTLVHDDIMDNADTRRGMQTIHKKWNENTAILSGDLLIGLAYSSLIKTKSKCLDKILKTFTEGIVEVCEGQSLDKDFEERKDVRLDEYMTMIKKKTARMLESSAVIGGLIADASAEQISNIGNYAVNIGLAFQIQDDLLDIDADENEFGKKIGGDLVEGKKTYLLLKAIEVINDDNDKRKIQNIINNGGLKTEDDKGINEIKKIYEKYGVNESAQKEIRHYTNLADKYLDSLKDGEHTERLKWFSEMLMGRRF